MEDFSGFKGSGRGIVLAEPQPSRTDWRPGRGAGRGMGRVGSRPVSVVW